MVELIIISPSHYVVTKWKTVKLDFLDLGDSLSWDGKAKVLSQLDVNGVLKLKFHRQEKYKKGSIPDWIEKDDTTQLKNYVLSPGIRELVGSCEFQAYRVLLVGSCKISVQEMDKKGEWIGHPARLGLEDAERRFCVPQFFMYSFLHFL